MGARAARRYCRWLAGLCWLLLAAPALAQGLLWKIEVPAAPAPSYLFGTIHTDDARVTEFSAQLTAALGSVDQFMLEVLPPSDYSLLVMREGSLRDLLGEQELAEVLRQADGHGLQESLALHMKPWLLAVVLAQPQSPGPFFQDMLLLATAGSQGKRIAPLEDTAEHFATLDHLALEEQLALLRAALAQSDAEKRQGFEALLAAYLTRDPERILAESDTQAARGLDAALWGKVRAALLERRNARMAERIAAELRQHTLFVAVGAAHLGGEGGLLRRLRAAGYTLTPLQ